jgi:hypothetical protein
MERMTGTAAHTTQLMQTKRTTDMKLKMKLMMFTATMALSTGMALADIDADALADDYLEEGYTYVEVKQGPTQTKVEAVRGDDAIEVIYDNETGEVIEWENQDADDDYEGKTGKDVKQVDDDFRDEDDSEDDEEEDDEDEDGDDEDDEDEDDGDDDEDDEDGDDEDGDDEDGEGN